MTHESHGHPKRTVCSYESCVYKNAWLNVLLYASHLALATAALLRVLHMFVFAMSTSR